MHWYLNKYYICESAANAGSKGGIVNEEMLGCGIGTLLSGDDGGINVVRGRRRARKKKTMVGESHMWMKLGGSQCWFEFK